MNLNRDLAPFLLDEIRQYMDVVEVVRCRNCEHWHQDGGDVLEHCRRYDFWTSGNWFCADGQRREDEK